MSDQFEEELGPIEVEVEDGSAVKSHRYLKKLIGQEGFIQEMKDKLRYTKPSKKRREKRREKERKIERMKEEKRKRREQGKNKLP